MRRGEYIVNMQTQEEKHHHGDIQKMKRGDSIMNVQTQEEKHHHGGPGLIVSSTLHLDSNHGIHLCEFIMNGIGNGKGYGTTNAVTAPKKTDYFEVVVVVVAGGGGEGLFKWSLIPVSTCHFCLRVFNFIKISTLICYWIVT
jgi:hypothetical protein